MRGTCAWPPTGLIPWFSKTEGNTYATLLHHPLLFGEIQRSAQEVARRISGAVAGEAYKKVIYQVPTTNPYPLHYFFASRFPLPHFSLAILFALLFAVCLPFASLLVCSCAACLLVIMASPLSAPLSPEFEVLHFKQKQGENLKDAWFRMMESYRNCTLEVNFRILLRKFYVVLNMSHR